MKQGEGVGMSKALSTIFIFALASISTTDVNCSGGKEGEKEHIVE